MTPVLFGAAYTVLLVAITCFAADHLIHKAQSKPILVQIAGNGHVLTDFTAAIAFAIVEGAAKIAVAKDAQ